MAVAKRKSSDKLTEYLAKYCEPLSPTEEASIDNEVLERTAEAMPKEMGMGYEELYRQAEAVRDPEDAQLPIWFWLSWLYGSKASETLKEHKDLEEKVFKFTRLFGDFLHNTVREQGLIYGHFVIGPHALIQVTEAGRPRLYTLKDSANTPEEALEFFELRPKLASTPFLEADLADPYRAFSMKPAQAVDRAARGPKGWSYLPLQE